MANNTNKYGSQGGGGGELNGVNETNFSPAGFNIVDGDGKVIKNVSVNGVGQASYTKLLTTADIGQKTIKAHFTGDKQYASGPLDSFSVKVQDGQGLNDTKGQAGTVNKIVAGPGIYISSPNGEGVVTISTDPLNLDTFQADIFDVSWSTIVYDYDNAFKPIYSSRPYGIPGQFTAVGSGGVVLRSRDADNWVQMFPYTQADMYAAASEINPVFNENNMEYVAVGSSGQAAFGILGGTTDSLESVGQLSDQDGLIDDDFYGVGIFVNDAVVVENKQFSGGLTAAAVNWSFAATTSTGAPLVVTSTAEVYAHYKITDVALRDSGGTPTIIFSDSANDIIKFDISMFIDEVRITPGTNITGVYKLLLKSPDDVIEALNRSITTVAEEAAAAYDAAYFSNLYLQWYGSDAGGAVQNRAYFAPHISIYVGAPGTTLSQVYHGYASSGYPYWVASNYNNTKLTITVGEAGVDLNIGKYEMRVDVKASHTRDHVDYSFTTVFTVGP